MEYQMTDVGRKKVERFLSELKAKRKEILDAGLDTIDETPELPTVQDIFDDLMDDVPDDYGEVMNGWYVTDHYDSDYPICLKLGVDFKEVQSETV